MVIVGPEWSSAGDVKSVGEVGDVGENGSEKTVSSADGGGCELRTEVSATMSVSVSLSLGWLGMRALLVPLSMESVFPCCGLPRPQRLAFGGSGFWPCLPTPLADGSGGGGGREWLGDGFDRVDRRGGGTAGGGFEAERRGAGTGGTRWEFVPEFVAEFRRSLGAVSDGVGGAAGVGVVGAVCADIGLTSTPSGIVLRSLLVPAECASSSSTARRRPRQRRA